MKQMISQYDIKNRSAILKKLLLADHTGTDSGRTHCLIVIPAITFTYRGKRCRERLKLAPTPANMKRAAQHRAAILDAIQKQTFDYRVTFPESTRAAQFAERKGEIVTVERYLDAWLEAQRAHLKASTYDGYRKVVNNHLIPAFGKGRLSDLSRAAVKE